MEVKKTLQTSSSKSSVSSVVDMDKLLASECNFTPLKPGPSRKLSLEQEFLLTLIRLRLGLLIEDLAFQVSVGKVSQITITWIKLLSKEMSILIK